MRNLAESTVPLSKNDSGGKNTAVYFWVYRRIGPEARYPADTRLTNFSEQDYDFATSANSLKTRISCFALQREILRAKLKFE